MILYHGSTVVVEMPKIIKTEYGRDFGFGFYTTDIKSQAVSWAQRKAMVSERKGISAVPSISIYEFDEKETQMLKIKHFNEPSPEWLDFVCGCRSSKVNFHNYDIVTGKIANDNVGETVSYVVRGIMRREDALERLKFEQINNQICFNTEKALKYLSYYGYEECR